MTIELPGILANLPWTLIGAQMVMLHMAEAGAPLGRTSADVDFLVDVRAVTGATADASARLAAAGFELSGRTPDERGMRFARRGLHIDILAPDNLGRHARTDTIDGARTIAVPGGTQALRRSQVVAVSMGGQTTPIPRPSLTGAILLKTRAVEVADNPGKHREDLVRLLGLVRDATAIRAELSHAERGWLARRTELQDARHPSWAAATNPEDAYLAFKILASGHRQT
ncbi:MAG: hypothetical protein M3082_11685 [Candidatus Dormibacteraeota bacterium]|nr:hypothetical protein [Candidatus Dormibacteraeota bacterium]